MHYIDIVLQKTVMPKVTKINERYRYVQTTHRIVDVVSDVNLAYSEHARRYLKDTSCAPERTYVTGSPMAEVLRANLDKIEASDVLTEFGFEPKRYMLLSVHREENIDTEAHFTILLTAINALVERYDCRPVLLPPALPQAPGGHWLPARPARAHARAHGFPRLQLPADERLRGGVRLRHPA